MNLIEQELQARQAIKQQLLELVLGVCQYGNGMVPRGCVQRYVWEQIGFKGRPSNEFARMLNRIINEQGCRNVIRQGFRGYAGLIWKEKDLSEQYGYHK